MIDNLEQIKNLLSFESDDDFYFVQIIKRKKEHPELGSNSYMVKSYFISSIESLERDYDEMVYLANFHNARVMINLNKRSYEKLAFQNLKKVADQIMNKDYKSVRKSYNSVVGQFSSDRNRKWIIDVDIKDMLIIDTIKEELYEVYHKTTGYYKIYGVIPTKNGYHIICSPFNLLLPSVDSELLKHDLHKENPTILYIP